MKSRKIFLYFLAVVISIILTLFITDILEKFTKLSSQTIFFDNSLFIIILFLLININLGLVRMYCKRC